VTINSIAKARLNARRGISSIVIPNVLDFSTQQPQFDDFNRDLRTDLGLKKDELLILQPTRVIQRKGIEMSIDIVKRLEGDNPHLFITHRADDEGLSYWQWLKREASVMSVDVQLIDHVIGAQRGKINDHKIYSLWDAYLNADLITYPSLYEGFGNALLESIYTRKLTIINRYPVYNADIKPLGFEFIELDGFVSENSIRQARELLSSPDQVKEITDKNYQLAQEYFSLEVLEKNLKELIANYK
jgi:glycosyltransferase involved in cell wall biosynthesis